MDRGWKFQYVTTLHCDLIIRFTQTVRPPKTNGILTAGTPKFIVDVCLFSQGFFGQCENLKHVYHMFDGV